MKINWNFLGEGVQCKKPSVGEVWIFLELRITTQYGVTRSITAPPTPLDGGRQCRGKLLVQGITTQCMQRPGLSQLTCDLPIIIERPIKIPTC